MDDIFGKVQKLYVAPVGSVDFKPLDIDVKNATLKPVGKGAYPVEMPTSTLTFTCCVKHKRTKRGKIRRDAPLERLLFPKRYRLPRKLKKRLKRENNGNLPFVINCEVIGRENDTLIVQANGLQYGTRQRR